MTSAALPKADEQRLAVRRETLNGSLAVREKLKRCEQRIKVISIGNHRAVVLDCHPSVLIAMQNVLVHNHEYLIPRRVKSRGHNDAEARDSAPFTRFTVRCGMGCNGLSPRSDGTDLFGL